MREKCPVLFWSCQSKKEGDVMGRQNILYSVLRAMCFVPGMLLAAGQPAEVRAPRQSGVEWTDQHLLFVADERSSKVRAFHLGNGAPVPLAESRSGRHARVRDMQVDASHGRLWVLGYSGVSVFDARTLMLQRFIPVEGAHLSALRLDGERVRLYSESGEAAGEIDRRGGSLGLLAAGVTENVLERAGVVVPGKAVN
jgi:hypothetical protein